MTKVEAINLIVKISDECNKHYKCSSCAFYNCTNTIEGCVWNTLLNEDLPSNFKNIIKAKVRKDK